jgi:thymidylate synthase ThyX
MNSLFDTYSSLIGPMSAWVEDRFPRRSGESSSAHSRAIRAKTLDILRGLLPAASLSHVGIFATGQTYEQLVLHLFAHPLAEARQYGEMILGELRTVIPSFLARVDRPDRGGEWMRHLRRRNDVAQRLAQRLNLHQDQAPCEPSVRLLEVRGSEDAALAALLFEQSMVSEEAVREAVAALSPSEKAQMFVKAVGSRPNRRHRPGRGFETLSYRFEIVSDYGAFRDLQRHRMCTVQWQPFTPYLGAEIPPEIRHAGLSERYQNALDISRTEYERLIDEGADDAARYALCMAYRTRYVIDINARAAVHLIELRSGRQGHVNYRRIAHQMHDLIAKNHPAVAESMLHVDRGIDDCLERIAAETAHPQHQQELVEDVGGAASTDDTRLFSMA